MLVFFKSRSLLWRWRQHDPSKRWHRTTTLQGVTIRSPLFESSQPWKPQILHHFIV